jgi:penicillin-binding protein 1C
MSSGLVSSTKRFYRRLTFRFKLSLIIVSALLLGALSYLLIPKPDLANYQTYSTAIFDRNDKLLRISLAQDERYRLYTPLENIAPHFQEASILYEDQHYYEHSGVDYTALFRAFWQTYVLQERRIGASTIVMQVARLRWNIPSNTLKGKVQQIFRALQLSRHYSKEALLEAYFNLAPYGGNIEGIGAASLIYFDKPASALSFAEALTLAVVPQNPSKRMPSRESGILAIQTAKQRLFERWLLKHPEDQELSSLLSLPLAVRQTNELPYHAPHFVQYVLSQQAPNYLIGSTNNGVAHQQIKGTIDLTLQNRLEDVLKAYITQNKTKGFSNASALLVNSKSMHIEAMIGSADFNNIAIHGQVNGTLAKRSPGSTLKPFVYALAMDAGLIHPMTMLKDLPKKYGGFAPENFGKGFVGPISAKDALIKSRNVPAVDLQSQLLELQNKLAEQGRSEEVLSFYEFLKKAGIKDLKEPDFYGLALALGGGEVSMLELVELYATISNLGAYKSVVSTYMGGASEDVESDNVALQLLSPEAAFLTFDILSKNPKPNAVNYSRNLTSNAPERVNQKKVAWKTGTSWAFRDAWAIGISGDYILATWIGNFDGEGNNAFIGRTAAGPLLFRLLEVLNKPSSFKEPLLSVTNEAQGSQTWLSEYDNGRALRQSYSFAPFKLADLQKLNVKWVDICETTGDLYEPECPNKGKSLFIPGVSPIKTANIYRKIWVDKLTGLRRCDKNPELATQKVYAFWPSDFQSLFTKAGVHIEKPPSFMPECELDEMLATGDNPQISSPQNAVNYVLEYSQNQRASIPLVASADAEVRYLYWFANEQFIGSQDLNEDSKSSPLIWEAKPGKYEVQVSDDFGRSSTVSVQIQAVK